MLAPISEALQRAYLACSPVSRFARRFCVHQDFWVARRCLLSLFPLLLNCAILEAMNAGLPDVCRSAWLADPYQRSGDGIKHERAAN